jgi:hypothetical protein
LVAPSGRERALLGELFRFGSWPFCINSTVRASAPSKPRRSRAAAARPIAGGARPIIEPSGISASVSAERRNDTWQTAGDVIEWMLATARTSRG